MTEAQVLTVVGKAATGGPSIEKKEEQLLNSPQHASSSILSYDVFEHMMTKVSNLPSIFFKYLSVLTIVKQNKDFSALVTLLIKGVITTTRVKDIENQLGEVCLSSVLEESKFQLFQ